MWLQLMYEEESQVANDAVGSIRTIASFCKVEFNQPSCWLYSVSNLLVFQHLVTLYLGGFCCKGSE